MNYLAQIRYFTLWGQNCTFSHFLAKITLFWNKITISSNFSRTFPDALQSVNLSLCGLSLEKKSERKRSILFTSAWGPKQIFCSFHIYNLISSMTIYCTGCENAPSKKAQVQIEWFAKPVKYTLAYYTLLRFIVHNFFRFSLVILVYYNSLHFSYYTLFHLFLQTTLSVYLLTFVCTSDVVTVSRCSNDFIAIFVNTPTFCSPCIRALLTYIITSFVTVWYRVISDWWTDHKFTLKNTIRCLDWNKKIYVIIHVLTCQGISLSC